ncbi:pyridoxal-dependent decarboxylase [Ureibacillus massiliensis]|uniref:pyridoxal-dependent decarboxylase n=1 Tax=Ureibacillus massiliensis TaxID=292806 RepID=UPI0005642F9E|nr:pyridoxal-dependent decarboxylase [Ureibacillus massiliensis]
MGIQSNTSLDHLVTPCYLIDENELNNNVLNLKNALNKYWNNFIIGYSVKTNSLPWLLDYFQKNNIFAEIVSDDEYELAQAIGYEKNRLIYNGVLKSKETFIEAIENGSKVNIDTQRELHWLQELSQLNKKKYEVGLRVNFDLEIYCPDESLMGGEGGRFGFCYENGELKYAIDFINSLKNVNLTGLHFHCSTKTRSLNIFRAISIVACEIKRRYSLNLSYIDVGGGFFGGLKEKPQFNDYIKVISDELSKEFNCNDVTLIVEPGTAIVSSPFSFITSVIDVKSTTANNFATIDGSNFNINPLGKKTKFFFNVKYRDKLNRQKIIKKQIVSGYTCMEDDRLIVLEDYPKLSNGDQIIFEKIGAYTMCFTPLFIKYFPSVYVVKDKSIRLVKEKWSAKELLVNEISNITGCYK